MRESLDASGVKFTVYDRVRVEPTDESFLDAIAFARQGSYDGIVAVGGGSTIDTAKAVNLYVTYPPADFLDYVNPPIGKGLPVPGPLKPLIAIPTTAGTGSETTGVTIFDFKRMHAKTGIASRRLKPTLGLLDPENTRTMPAPVAASSGLDILSHAIESFTALPYTGRPLPERPLLRPAYQGSNPISDIWSLASLRHGQQVPDSRGRRSVRRRGARADDSRGVVRGRRLRQRRRASAARHVVSGVGQREELRRAGLLERSSARAARVLGDPERAGGLPFHGVGQSGAASAGRRSARRGRVACKPADAGRMLADRITWFMQQLHTPNGLKAIGYSSSDIPALVEGTLPQHRVTKLSPRPAGPEDLAALFEDAMVAW